MKFKLKTHYSIKILIFLAHHEMNNNSLLDIYSISDTLDIKYEHTRKIIQTLVKLNMLESVRGRNGGIKLARPKEDIHIYDLILEIEDVKMKSLINDCNNCTMPLDCKFKHIVRNEQRNFYRSFKGLYLNELV